MCIVYTLEDITSLFHYLDNDRLDPFVQDETVMSVKVICAVSISREEVDTFVKLITDNCGQLVQKALFRLPFDEIPLCINTQRYRVVKAYRDIINWRLKRGK